MEMFNEDFQWRSSSVICNGDAQGIFSMDVFNGGFQRRYPMDQLRFLMEIFNGGFQWRFSTEIFNGDMQWSFSMEIINCDL